MYDKLTKPSFVYHQTLIVADGIGTVLANMSVYNPGNCEVGQRRGFEFVNILNNDHTFKENAGGRFQSVKHSPARKSGKVFESI